MLLYLEDMKAREVEQFSQDHTARMKSTQDNHQCLLVHWDDPEGWYGEGGGRRVQDGEHMCTCGGFILKTRPDSPGEPGMQPRDPCLPWRGKLGPGHTCVPHPEPSSLFPPHTIPLGRPSAPAPSIQYCALNLDWQLVSYMIFYTALNLSFLIFLVGSVAQSCLTLCDPMDCSTLGFPVHHQLLEFTQTHVHRAGVAIQPSHPLLSPSPPALNLAQHQGLFK